MNAFQASLSLPLLTTDIFAAFLELPNLVLLLVEIGPDIQIPPLYFLKLW